MTLLQIYFLVFWKPVTVWQSYRQEYNGNFLTHGDQQRSYCDTMYTNSLSKSDLQSAGGQLRMAECDEMIGNIDVVLSRRVDQTDTVTELTSCLSCRCP